MSVGRRSCWDKPVTTSDVMNTGYMDKNLLAAAAKRARTELGWRNGFMYWQFASDKNG